MQGGILVSTPGFLVDAYLPNFAALVFQLFLRQVLSRLRRFHPVALLGIDIAHVEISSRRKVGSNSTAVEAGFRQLGRHQRSGQGSRLCCPSVL